MPTASEKSSWPFWNRERCHAGRRTFMASTPQDNDDAIFGINVTPLVDITLVLLIIFMATAHMIVHRSMNLSLPKVAHSENVPTQSVQVLLASDKSLKLNGQPVD